MPIDVDGSGQGRATGVTVGSSLGSAKAAGKLPVAPASMAADDPAFVVAAQACHSLLSVMRMFFASVCFGL